MKKLLIASLVALTALHGPAFAAEDAYTRARGAFLAGKDDEVPRILTPAAIAKIRNKSHAALWKAISQARSGDKGLALGDLKSYHASSKESAFIDRIVEFYLGAATEKSVLDSAKEPWQKCEAGFYVGAFRKFFDGDDDRAKELFQMAVDSGTDKFSEFQMAAKYVDQDKSRGAAAAGEPEAKVSASTTISLETALRADSLGQRDEAIRQYRGLIRGIADPALGSMVRSRIFTLSREVYDERAAAAVGQESRLANSVGPDNTVAVGRFENLSEDETSAPLEKGIPAMLSSDMAQVKKLTLLERVELEAVLRELSLSRSSMFDSSTAPRLGHLLSAGRVVVGSFRSEKSDQLQMNSQVVNVKSGRVESSVKVSGRMRDFFTLEKDLVFSLVDKLGVRLTTAERNTIERQVPTKDLAAFLAYGRGLDEEDRGNFKGASEQYQAAASKDPGFTEAKAAAAATGRGTISFGDLAKGVRAHVAPQAPKPVAAKPGPSGGDVGSSDIVMERAFETERLTGSGLVPDLGSGEAHDRQATRPAVSSNGTVIVTGSLPR